MIHPEAARETNADVPDGEGAEDVAGLEVGGHVQLLLGSAAIGTL